MTTSPIPFFNYPALFLQDEEKLVEIFRDVGRRGAYILQRDVAEFEDALKEFLSVKHAVAVSDATNALILGLRALEVKAGDEIILPSHTFIASASAIYFAGAKPVLCDIGPDNLMDPESVLSRITSNTKAIMPVQLNGRVCNMDKLQEIASAHQLHIVEDSAQALGAKFKEQGAGTFGSFGVFSFYPAKSLGCLGDGGALVTNDDEIAHRVKMYRDHGRAPDGNVVAWGTNSRLDNLQAAILNHKIKTFRDEIVRRRAIASQYHNMLVNVKELKLPPQPSDGPHFDTFQNYEMAAENRDALKHYLKEKGIGTAIQWGGMPLHHFKELVCDSVLLPATEKFFKECIMLPMNTALSNDQVTRVCEAVRRFYQ